MIAQRGVPAGVKSIESMSSGGPAAHAANDGEASNPLSCIASFMRSASGKNWSSSNTPSLRIGGVATMLTSVIRSSGAPFGPRVVDQVGEQDVLPTRERVGVDARRGRAVR